MKRAFLSLFLLMIFSTELLSFETAQEVKLLLKGKSPTESLEILTEYHAAVGKEIILSSKNIMRSPKLSRLIELESCQELLTIAKTINIDLTVDQDEQWLVIFVFLHTRCEMADQVDFSELENLTPEAIRGSIIKWGKLPKKIDDEIKYYEQMGINPIYHRLKDKLNRIPPSYLQEFYLENALTEAEKEFSLKKLLSRKFAQKVSYNALLNADLYFNRVLAEELFRRQKRVDGLGMCRSYLASLLNTYPREHVYSVEKGELDGSLIPKSGTPEEKVMKTIENVKLLMTMRSDISRLDGQLRYLSQYSEIPDQFLSRQMEAYLQSPSNDKGRLKAMKRLRKLSESIKQMKTDYSNWHSNRIPLTVSKAPQPQVETARKIVAELARLLAEKKFSDIALNHNPRFHFLAAKEKGIKDRQESYQKLFDAMLNSEEWFQNGSGNLYFSVGDLKRKDISLSDSGNDLIFELRVEPHVDGKYSWYLHKSTVFQIKVNRKP